MSLSEVPTLHTSPSRVRNYESTKADGAPLVFAIDGEEFFCLPECPGLIYLDVAHRLEVAGADDGKQGMASLSLIRDFFNAVLVKTDAGETAAISSHERFFELLRAPKEERIVGIGLLSEVMKDLMQDYGGRPTTPGSPSPG